ncbi:hypothetical protein P3T76_015922 [Phytophthora citrophthora]|uniref:DDE Tnp4 domain-containing protein n=1 Tax=Phytophthora citrophthora TaxID=4793 RepID=A0AAD9FYH4_9STRA|nr:hypothetical protein P3T76_015922 [Phytophthora citrophthora]
MWEHEKEVLRTKIPGVRLNINADFEKDCIEQFRFNKFQLAYLLMIFRLPASFFFFFTNAGYRASGIEVLCIALERITYPTRWREQVRRFERSESNLSSIFYFVCGHMCSSAKRQLRQSQHPARRLCLYDSHKRIRALQLVESDVYKHSHAVNFQSIVTPDGMTVQLSRPVEGRALDLTLVDEPKLNESISPGRCFRGYLLHDDPGYGQTNVFACLLARLVQRTKNLL